MRRVLALVMACVLILSHGGVGVAAPHFGAADHHATHAHGHDADDDHHESEDAATKAGHVAHTHAVANLVEPHNGPGAAFASARTVARPPLARSLASLALPPLLEPPAA